MIYKIVYRDYVSVYKRSMRGQNVAIFIRKVLQCQEYYYLPVYGRVDPHKQVSWEGNPIKL